MSQRNVSQPIVISIDKISRNFTDYFLSENKSEWVNRRPVLLNGDSWCKTCQTWHRLSKWRNKLINFFLGRRNEHGNICRF